MSSQRSCPSEARSTTSPLQRCGSAEYSASSDASSSSGVGDAMSLEIDTSTPFKVAKQGLVEEFERRYIGRLLDEHEGNISAAARAAGIDRMSIHKMLNRLGMDNPRNK